jgi:Skp family chaperone for outer membrane proteins
MIKSIVLNLLFFLCAISFAFAQDSTSTQNSLDSGTITSQFDYIYRVSNNFKEYEVVDKSNLEKLKSNVLDSIQTLSKEVSDLKIHMSTLDDSVVIVKELLSAEIEEKNQAIADRDNFNFLGMGIQKGAYSSMMWFLVLALSGALTFFALQYFRSSSKIAKAEKDLVDVQEEFEQHRKNTLERERKLKRELIDAQMGKI